MAVVSRREFFERALKWIASIPLVGGVGVFLASPLFRFLKPTAKPLVSREGFPPQPEKASVERTPVATLSELVNAWDYKYFLFEQKIPEYTRRAEQSKVIPGVLVRLPDDLAGQNTRAQKGIVAYNRICPHLGCIFNFENDPDKVAAGYSYRPSRPVFACPCHFSVYDIADNAKVISGPAPRPARYLQFEIAGDQIYVTGMEEGGIA